MEGTIGEIRIFGGTFAPSGWMLCQGQTLPISEYSTLYSLIGTTYGGDGQASFNLPDMRSKVVVGADLSNYVVGQTGGTENVTLNASALPVHAHPATITPNTGVATATLTLNGAANNTGGNTNPESRLLGTDSNCSIYATDQSRITIAKMSTLAVQISKTTLTTAGIPSGVAGGSTPHNNIQPYTAINYIICWNGTFPSRN